MPTLNVTVNRVAYPAATSDADAWYILLTDHGACKGSMSWRPRENEYLTLDGEWSQYKGEREFAFKGARLNVPTNARDQLHYVCMRTSGLGSAMETLIWEKCGAAWQEVTEGQVKRLSGRLYQEFKLQLEGLRDKSEEAQTIAALMGRGATMNLAVAAWTAWEKEALGVVNADCYRLAELANYGFKDVDRKIRLSYGIADDDKRRIRAGVIYALRRLTDPGDTVAEWDALYTQTIGLLGGYAELITECTTELFEDGSLKAFPESEGVSLAADWKAETTIWDYVKTATGEREKGEIKNDRDNRNTGSKPGTCGEQISGSGQESKLASNVGVGVA